MTVDEQFIAIKRGTLEIVPEEALKAKLKKAQDTNKPLRIKLGLDPTAPYIHLGHAVVLRKMRQFQDFGHEVCIIIGDFTAMIGDPSGKSITRPQLTEDEIKENAKTYYDQYCLILDPEKTNVVFNSEWLGKLNFADVIKIVSKVTVARILERDDFATRLAENRPISMHELLYPVCQAYDSVELHSDVELGGTDQKFNILMGRDLQTQYGQEEQIGLFMPILPGLDGVQKMSKSLGNYIGITDEPEDMFGKVMSLSDDMMPTYFELCTDVPLPEIETIKQDLTAGKVHPMDVKKRLAREIVGIYHSTEAAKKAQEEFERVFSQREVPEDMPEVALSNDDLVDGKIPLVKLVAKAKLSGSNSESRRLIDQGAVSIDGQKITDQSAMVQVADGQVLRVGRLRFARLLVS